MKSKQAFNKIKNVASVFFIIILAFQVFTLGYVAQSGDKINTEINAIKDIKVSVSEKLINDMIRQEERQALNSIRQSWLQYITINNNDILVKSKDKFLFKNSSGEYIYYDPSYMNKTKDIKGNYTITDNSTNNVLITNARPVWNTQTINDILNVIIYPNKTFGENSNIIVYDLYDGTILMDNYSEAINSKDVLDTNGVPNLYNYTKHPNNLNPTQYKDLLPKLFTRSDTQIYTQLISLFHEGRPNLKDEDINNFSIYDLGDLNRGFVEKIVLPYESVGIEGLDMQLGVMIIVQEEDIYQIYKDDIKQFESNIESLIKEKELICMLPIISVIASLLVIMIAITVIRTVAYYCKDKE